MLERLGGSEPRLRITAAGRGECVGSFRTKVLLPAGRYELHASMTMAGVESLYRGGPVDTPEMAVRYTGLKESLFWRD